MLSSDDFCVLLGACGDRAFEFLRHRQPSWNTKRLWFNNFTIDFLFGNVERPENSSNVDEHGALRHMYTRTDTPSRSIGEVVSCRRIRSVQISCCRRWVTQVSFGVKIVWILPHLWVEVDSPEAKMISIFKRPISSAYLPPI